MTERAIFKKCDNGTWVIDTPVTNFNKMIAKLDESDLAMLISDASQLNSCQHCIHRHKANCDGKCVDGIEAWLKMECEA